MLLKFPDRAFRLREASRRPRRSKNGTPEERAQAAAPVAETRVRKQRRSKNGTPEERAAKKLPAALIQIEPLRAIMGSPPTKATGPQPSQPSGPGRVA
jgi:hypothetical protein